MLPTLAGLNPRHPGLQSNGASNRATEASALSSACDLKAIFAKSVDPDQTAPIGAV